MRAPGVLHQGNHDHVNTQNQLWALAAAYDSAHLVRKDFCKLDQAAYRSLA